MNASWPTGHPHAFALSTTEALRPALYAVVQRAHARCRARWLDHRELEHAAIDAHLTESLRAIEEEIAAKRYKTKGAQTRVRNRRRAFAQARAKYYHACVNDDHVRAHAQRHTLDSMPSTNWNGGVEVLHRANRDGTLTVTVCHPRIGAVATLHIAAGDRCLQARLFGAIDAAARCIRVTAAHCRQATP